MNPRERVQAALSHREPDRTPMFEYVLLPPVASMIIGRTFVDYGGDEAAWRALAKEQGWERRLHRYAADRLDLAAALGHDLLYVTPNPAPPVPREPAEVGTVRESDDPVENLRRRNEAERASAGFDLEPRLLVYRLLAEEMRRRGVDLPVMAPAYGLGVKTDVDLMQAMLPDPAAPLIIPPTRVDVHEQRPSSTAGWMCRLDRAGPPAWRRRLSRRAAVSPHRCRTGRIDNGTRRRRIPPS
jgi:hypothetical protein